MIATLQKQHPHHSLMVGAGGPAAFLQHHRRNPSAPALTVHPTGTRGLLALAKPSPITKLTPVAAAKIPSSKHQHQSHRLPPTNNNNTNVATQQSRTTLPPPPQAAASTDSTQIDSVSSPSPPKEHRERGRKPRAANVNVNSPGANTTMTPTTPPKTSNKRSASHHAGSSRRHQPDPEPSAEKEDKKEASQTSPRRRPAQHQRHNTAPPSPVVAFQRPPAGKGTRAGRRERHKSTPSSADASAAAPVVAPQSATPDVAGAVPTSLAPAATIAVPVPARTKKNVSSPSGAQAHYAQGQSALSRSAPMEHSAPAAFSFPSNSHALSDWDLPAALASPPRRPALSLEGDNALAWMNAGPRTAPLARSHHFPAYSPPATPTPAPAPVSSSHRRAPSQPVATMFAFEDDNDNEPFVAVPSGTRSADVSPLRFVRANRAATAAALEAARKKQDEMWAASKFQTGPPLRDLPAPGL